MGNNRRQLSRRSSSECGPAPYRVADTTSVSCLQGKADTVIERLDDRHKRQARQCSPG
ncbi:MAG: hypothetical protein MJE77_29305 [Proteobacteria bacterium]|nr:hypothetical protein [Pseudomonadota bacterium]